MLSEIFHLMQSRRTAKMRHVGPIMVEAFDELGELKKNPGGVTGLQSGFTKLDQMASGWQPGDMIVLAGRPSMGKTAFALCLARNAAVKSGVPVGFFSLEMTAKQLAYRLLSTETGIDSYRLRNAMMKEDEWELSQKKVVFIADTPLYIDDTPALSVSELRSEARRIVNQENVGLIIIDYIGLMELRESYDSQQHKIAEISRQLKSLAKELNVPIIVLSQLSRAVENRPKDNKPRLSDLRDSGAIEQDADVVLFLYRRGVYDEKTDQSEVELIVAKQRNGKTGSVDLRFEMERGRFLQAREVKGVQPAVHKGAHQGQVF